MEITAIYNEIHTHRILQLLFTHYEITILIATRQQNRKVLKLVQIPYLTAAPPPQKKKEKRKKKKSDSTISPEPIPRDPDHQAYSPRN